MVLKIVLLLIFAIHFGTIQAQSMKEVWKLYNKKKYEKVIQVAQDYLEKKTNNAEWNLVLGRALVETRQFHKSVPFLETTIQNPKARSWQKAWALNYLGRAHFAIGEHETSKSYLQKCIKLNATKNSKKKAQAWLSHFGFSKYFQNWQTIESKYFIFHFTPNSKISQNEFFVSQHEAVFEENNLFFNSTLPKKIDFFVWDSRDEGKRIRKRPLGFTHASYCIINAHSKQSPGHEITHALSHYSVSHIKKTMFVDEGTSVCFDLRGDDKLRAARRHLQLNKINELSIKDLWDDFNLLPENSAYKVSGAFISLLIEKEGTEKFLQLLSNQTFKNAKEIYGDKLDEIILDFEKQLFTPL